MSPLSSDPCIYCGGRRNDPRWSVEHIWPQSLGGAASPPEFQTRQVCKTCNDLCGLWVDAGFTKTFFGQAEAAQAAEAFLDPASPGVLPLVYMGVDTEFPSGETLVCERWLGPCGEHVYHMHEKDDAKWDAYAGGDIRRRKRDPGRVYLYLTSVELYWVQTALASVAARFPNAKRRCLTIVGGLPLSPGFLSHDEQELTEQEAREITFIRGRGSGVHHAQMTFQVDASDRFLAKLALGFGRTLLGSAAASSAYSDELRRLLWLRRPFEQLPPKVRTINFWAGLGDPHAQRFLGFEGTWTLTFQVFGADLFLVVSTPSLRTLGICVSEDPALWASGVAEAIDDGVTYLLQPQRRLCLGPIPYPEFVAHRLGNHQQSDLVHLESLRTAPSARPPKRPPA